LGCHRPSSCDAWRRAGAQRGGAPGAETGAEAVQASRPPSATARPDARAAQQLEPPGLALVRPQRVCAQRSEPRPYMPHALMARAASRHCLRSKWPGGAATVSGVAAGAGALKQGCERQARWAAGPGRGAVEAVYGRSATLDGEAVVVFVRALCAVSQEELDEPGAPRRALTLP